MSVCFVAVRVTAGRCSVVERRLFTSLVRMSRQYCSSPCGVGVEPRGGWVGGVGTLLGPEGSSLPALCFGVVGVGCSGSGPGVLVRVCGGGGFPVVV